MVQIFGKILNNKKQVYIALKNIGGLNIYQIQNICNELNIGLDCKISDLSQFYIIRLLKLFEKKRLLIEASLKKDIQSNIRRLTEIKSYRGLKSIRKKSIFSKIIFKFLKNLKVNNSMVEYSTHNGLVVGSSPS